MISKQSEPNGKDNASKGWRAWGDWPPYVIFSAIIGLFSLIPFLTGKSNIKELLWDEPQQSATPNTIAPAQAIASPLQTSAPSPIPIIRPSPVATPQIVATTPVPTQKSTPEPTVKQTPAPTMFTPSPQEESGEPPPPQKEKAESHLSKCRQRYKESKEFSSIQSATEALREAINECEKAKKLGSSDPLITVVSEDPRAKNLN